jgi:hypothetical protein
MSSLNADLLAAARVRLAQRVGTKTILLSVFPY